MEEKRSAGRRFSDVSLSCLVWLGLWGLTPGLLRNGVGSFVSEDPSTRVLLESALALLVLAVLAALHRHVIRRVFARSRLVRLYALPVASAAVLPLHYGMPLPVAVYAVWMTASVVWQNTLTFGLLQSRLGEHLRTGGSVALTAAMFWLGHAVYLPAFAPTSPTGLVAGVAIFAMGLLFAWIRQRTGTLHLLLVLHLTFYFIAVWRRLASAMAVCRSIQRRDVWGSCASFPAKAEL